MSRETQLSKRKAAILRALVQHYIRTGEPVGSEALAQASGLRVSSATIRNELASLEELGFLTQPHTSAGRAPTDLAYRYYVDLLPTRSRLRDTEGLRQSGLRTDHEHARDQRDRDRRDSEDGNRARTERRP